MKKKPLRTLDDEFDEALSCEDRVQADAWLYREAVWLCNEFPEEGYTIQRAQQLIRQNLGYYAGYIGPEAQRKIYELFDAPHPILGTPAQMESLSPEEIFELGQRWGAAVKEGQSMSDPVIVKTEDGRSVAYVRANHSEEFQLQKFGPKDRDLGYPCLACGKALKPGEYTTLIPLGPGDDSDEQERARNFRWYNAVAVEVHWACATGGEP